MGTKILGYLFVAFIVLFVPAIYVLESVTPKSKVVVVGKHHEQPHAWFDSDEYKLIIKHLNGTKFHTHTYEYIFDVDAHSYENINIGDTLKKNH